MKESRFPGTDRAPRSYAIASGIRACSARRTRPGAIRLLIRSTNPLKWNPNSGIWRPCSRGSSAGAVAELLSRNCSGGVVLIVSWSLIFNGADVSQAKGKRRRGQARSGARNLRTRSFPCPDDLWNEVESFARERDLGAPAAAARVLLRSGLAVERRVRELATARDWQIERAWTELKKIAAGDREFGSWAEIEKAAERARQTIRERAAASVPTTASS